jgi:hypothetical protein
LLLALGRDSALKEEEEWMLHLVRRRRDWGKTMQDSTRRRKKNLRKVFDHKVALTSSNWVGHGQGKPSMTCLSGHQRLADVLREVQMELRGEEVVARG